MTPLPEPIIVERVLSVSPDTVWQAITEPEQMRQWFFDNIPDFEPRVGFSTWFDVDSGQRIFPHVWIILEAVPGERIVYDWRYDGYDGVSRLTMALAPEGPDRTRFRIVHETLEPFDNTIPEFQSDSCRTGWNYFMDRLAGYLKQ